MLLLSVKFNNIFFINQLTVAVTLHCRTSLHLSVCPLQQSNRRPLSSHASMLSRKCASFSINTSAHGHQQVKLGTWTPQRTRTVDLRNYWMFASPCWPKFISSSGWGYFRAVLLKVSLLNSQLAFSAAFSCLSVLFLHNYPVLQNMRFPL